MSDNVQFQILLVEDNDGDADLVKEYIAEMGKGIYSLARAKTLAEADKLRDSGHFDCVLLDLNLPDSKGLDTLYFFCEHCKAKVPPPIVVLTGLDDEETANRAMQSCAHDYLVKGDITAKNLLRAIRFAVQRHSKEQMESLLKEQPTVLSIDQVDRDSIADLAAKGVDEIKVAMTVLNRLNKSNFGQAVGEGDSASSSTTPGDLQLVLQHMSVGQKAGEAVMMGLDQIVANQTRRLDLLAEAINQLNQRVGHIDKSQSSAQVSLSDMRGDLRLIVQQLRPMVSLVEGNGKSPLVARLESMERTIADKLEHVSGRPVRANHRAWPLAARLLGIIATAFAVWAATHWYYVHGRTVDGHAPRQLGQSARP